MPVLCTIVTPSTVAPARVMAETFARQHPDWQLIAAGNNAVRWRDDDPFEILDESAGVDSVASLLRHALVRDPLAAYLAPTVCVYGPLDPVLDAARAHGLAAVPRLRSLPDDGLRPDAGDLARAGTVSAGLVVASAPAGGAAVDRWARQVDAAHDRGATLPDGEWLALAAGADGGVTLVDDPGCQLSAWNLHERALHRDGDAVVVDGRPLRTIAFDGFSPDHPYWLDDVASRISVVADPTLAELVGDYGARVREAGWHPSRRRLVAGDRLGNGQLVDRFVDLLWVDAGTAGLDFGDPMDATAAEAFCAWMRDPAEHGVEMGVNRYLHTVHRERPDLMAAFPDLDRGDGERLVAWGWSQGGRDVLADLVPVPTGLPGTARPGTDRIAVDVIGFLSEGHGLGQAGRAYVAALEAAGVPVTTSTQQPEIPDSAPAAARASTEWRDRASATAPAINLACVNADHLAGLVRARGPQLLGGRPTIGQWGWETDVLPLSWDAGVRLVDEVWVYSRFVAENLGRRLPVPVVVVPPAVLVAEPADEPSPLHEAGRFTFLTMVDLHSTLERKNPVGLIRAFSRAFAEDEGPRLLVKTTNAAARPQAAEELRFAAAGRCDITIVDTFLDDRAKARLVTGVDCYVSLHRSEGFGLPLAEAMALGTPVIATDYSGNTDFMTPFNSRLVDWTPSRVGPGSSVYPAHGRWAEPDLEQAAEAMREVVADPATAAARATRARDDIERLYAPRVVGEIARGRLERLATGRAASLLSNAAGPAARAASAEIDRVADALSIDPRTDAGVLSRVALRLIRPFSSPERAVDQAMLDALRALQADAASDQSRDR